MGSVARAGLLLGLLAAAAGCGADGPSGDDAQASRARYDLTVIFWPQGKDGPSRTASLTCDPNGGTHPDPTRACAGLDAHPEALHPVPGDVACTEIYGGDQVAEVTGVSPESGSLRAILNRTNGCEIARWEALAPVIELPD